MARVRDTGLEILPHDLTLYFHSDEEILALEVLFDFKRALPLLEKDSDSVDESHRYRKRWE